MKQTKHALSIFLCLLMLFSCMVPAFAETNKRIIYYVAPPEGNLNVAVPETLDPSTDWDFLANAIHTLLYTSETEVDISSLNIPYSDSNVDSVYSFIWYEPTALRTKNVGYWTIQANGTRIIGGLAYEGDWQANLARYNQCLEAIDQLMYGIKDNNNLSQYEKCLLLHDRLAAWTEYDKVNYEKKKAGTGTIPDDSYSAYGALVGHVAVCNGYALAYGWMLDILGIENYYTSSDMINHGWNKVILDDQAYYVDVTWDDPTWDVQGRVEHKHFMVSYNTFSASHQATDFDSSPDSTTYETAFDKQTASEIVYLNGKFWYIDKASKKLMNCSSMGNNATEVKQLETKQYISQNSYYGYEPKMTAIGDSIIYLNGKEIRAFDTKTTADQSVFTPADRIFANDYYYLIGLRQLNGTIEVTANNSPMFDENTKANYTDTYNYCTHTDKAVLEKTVGPDCKTAGDLKEICADCRAMFKTPGGGDKGDHNYQATDTTAATCTAQGYTTYTCTVCGNSYNADYTAMLPHDWEWVTDTPATCGTAGSKHEECKTCTATQSLNTVIPATGSHSYTAQTVKADALKSAATCTAPATYYYSCAICGKVENNAGHTFTSGSPAAHTFTAQTVKADALKAAATCTAAAVYYYSCANCGKVEKSDSHTFMSGSATEHVWEWVIDKNATCVAAGSKHEECKTCTATQSLNTVIPATGSHSYTAQTVKADALKSAATCTAPATYYYSCTTCGKVENNVGHTFTSGSPAAHTFTAQTVKADALKAAATCTAAAVYYYSCVNCGKVEKNDSHTFMSGSATEHVWEWVIDKNATCVTAGSKHEKCKNCTATRSENTVIPATGSHSYTAQTVKADALKSAATCTAPATYYYSCTTCGKVENNVGHTFTSGSASAHVDANGDSRCDNCNKDLSEPQPEPQNLCKYCHKEHTGFFGKIVQFFHNILYSLTHLFKK